MMNKSNNSDEETEKVEEADSELNKLEENILKIFSSSSDATMKSKDKTVLITATVFMLVFALCWAVVLALAFPTVAQNFYDNSPHMGFILGTSPNGFSVFGAVDNMIQLSNCH